MSYILPEILSKRTRLDNNVEERLMYFGFNANYNVDKHYEFSNNIFAICNRKVSSTTTHSSFFKFRPFCSHLKFIKHSTYYTTQLDSRFNKFYRYNRFRNIKWKAIYLF